MGGACWVGPKLRWFERGKAREMRNKARGSGADLFERPTATIFFFLFIDFLMAPTYICIHESRNSEFQILLTQNI